LYIRSVVTAVIVVLAYICFIAKRRYPLSLDSCDT